MYQKPTHTDQYLQWDSHHSLSSKYSVIGTLTHRAKIVCTNSELLQDELNHLRRALGKCCYHTWVIIRVQQKVLNNTRRIQEKTNPIDNNSTSGDNNGNTNINNQANSTTNNRPTNKVIIGQIVIPYTKGTAESIKCVCSKYGIQVHFKGNTTIKQTLMKPKDQDPKDNKSGQIYSYQCPQIDWNDEYIGKTFRTLGDRRREHLKQPSPIYGHSKSTGHPIEKQQLQHHRKGGLGAGKDHQGINIHKGKQPHIKPKYW